MSIMSDSYSLCYIAGPIPLGTSGRPPGAWVVDSFPTAQDARDWLAQILLGAATSTGSSARVGQYILAAHALDAGEVDQAEVEGYTYLVVPDTLGAAQGFAQSSAPNVVATTG